MAAFPPFLLSLETFVFSGLTTAATNLLAAGAVLWQ
jgi:hypothetical protein